ncbi:class I SAM-dependent methyltransferase [Candidatus Thioglobus sp.]|nr:class I SAM-dependent methyltransferase [Candidatus Thioglobus sp.]
MHSRKIPTNKSNCPICSQLSDQTTAYNDIGWSDFGIFNKLKIKYCIHCGFGYSSPEIDTKVINYFYEKQYRSKESTFHINFSKLKDANVSGVADIRDIRSFGQLSLARAFCNFNSEDVLLDIGPGTGESFNVAKTLFNNPKLHAIELSQGAKEHYKKNYGALSHDSLNDFISMNLKAQIILMSHSLEHYRLSDLSELFSTLSIALAKNGVAVIEVPSVDFRLHLKNRGADTPHFLFFSRESLMLLFEKYSFDVLFIDTCGNYYISDEEYLKSNPDSSKLKTNLKQNFNKLPKSLKIILRTLFRAFTKTKNFRLINKVRVLNFLPQLSYGGNRDCIRMVIRNKI